VKKAFRYVAVTLAIGVLLFLAAVKWHFYRSNQKGKALSLEFLEQAEGRVIESHQALLRNRPGGDSLWSDNLKLEAELYFKLVKNHDDLFDPDYQIPAAVRQALDAAATSTVR
jgi:hypothetical protein